jgi:hypothetical protein
VRADPVRALAAQINRAKENAPTHGPREGRCLYLPCTARLTASTAGIPVVTACLPVELTPLCSTVWAQEAEKMVPARFRNGRDPTFYGASSLIITLTY